MEQKTAESSIWDKCLSPRPKVQDCKHQIGFANGKQGLGGQQIGAESNSLGAWMLPHMLEDPEASSSLRVAPPTFQYHPPRVLVQGSIFSFKLLRRFGQDLNPQKRGRSERLTGLLKKVFKPEGEQCPSQISVPTPAPCPFTAQEGGLHRLVKCSPWQP